MKQMIQKTTHIGLSLFLLAGLLAGFVALDDTQTARAAADVAVTFNYTGGVQTWTVPAGVTQVTLDVFGAQGGYEAAQGGLGGEATATIAVTPGDTLTIVVGGMGHSPFNGEGPDGGFNGGGNGGAPYSLPAAYYGSGGGGASDVRIGGTDLAYRVIVAGGGGGAANEFGPNGSAYGGTGGGLIGGTGNSAYIPYAPSGGAGGNQDGTTGSGQLGQGSNGVDSTSTIFNGVGAGGGGGGYYGGAGGSPGTGGGGGSGYGPTGTVFATGVRSGYGQVLVTYTPPNAPPTATAGGAYSGNEGSAIALSGANASDSDGDSLTYGWSVNSALCSFGDASALNPNLTCIDNGNYTATLSVNDGVNPAVTSDASVTVNNVAPTLGAINVDAELVSVNFAITASATFTDPGALDTHTATWGWGDGTSAGTVTESAGSGSVSDSHSYSIPGIYTIDLTVTDKDGGVSNDSIFQYVVVYDPSAGFVTGGGWIDSPAGAYTPDPSLSGKATFGFVSKYKKGANVPSGNTEFQFKAGDFNFHSDTYDWLVVNQGGANAQFKGSGTVNGALDDNGNAYKFMLWAGDGSPDTFRIKIWSEDASGVETVVYDNGTNQAIGGGSIVVHN